MKKTVPFLLIIGIAFGNLCAKSPDAKKKGVIAMDTIKIESAAFKHLQPIPSQYTCDGADISPPLSWSTIPATAKSLVLIADDPDAPAGTWVHWVVYDLPPATDTLQENLPKTDTLAGGGKQGRTDFNRVGWNGPCPPSGTHRYFFKLYALDIALNLPAGKAKKEIEKAMKGHILAKGELAGTYKRGNN
jgi:Raf kinase inhibitor-like YbhB/YbcL family protein